MGKGKHRIPQLRMTRIEDVPLQALLLEAIEATSA
jgi:hypothetical protein